MATSQFLTLWGLHGMEQLLCLGLHKGCSLCGHAQDRSL